MKGRFLHMVLLPIFLALLSTEAWGQMTHSLPKPGEMQMNTPPPPVGLELPIDSGIVFLAIAGLVLGGYYFRKKTVTG